MTTQSGRVGRLKMSVTFWLPQTVGSDAIIKGANHALTAQTVRPGGTTRNVDPALIAQTVGPGKTKGNADPVFTAQTGQVRQTGMSTLV